MTVIAGAPDHRRSRLIGSTIADQLVEAGVDSIVVLDDLSRGRTRTSPVDVASGVELVEGDIRDRRTCPSAAGRRRASSTRRPCASRSAPTTREPRSSRWPPEPSTCSRPADGGRRKVVAASSASIYGMADSSRPPRTTTRTATGPSTARPSSSTRACCAASTDMYGLDYVALRYFNVYGPRMDVHGAYTEVLVRWMERIERGEAPLIFGDGSQTMDFVHVDDVARANVLAESDAVTDQVFNVASGVETSLLDLAQRRSAGEAPTSSPSSPRPARSILSSAASPAPTPHARASASGTRRPRRRAPLARRLVALRRQPDARDERPMTALPMSPPVADAPPVRSSIPIMRPTLGEEEIAEVTACSRPGGWRRVPRSGVRGRLRRVSTRTDEAIAVSSCTTGLHLALVVLGIGPGDEVIVPSCRSSPPPTSFATWVPARSSPTSTSSRATSYPRPSNRSSPIAPVP